MVNDRSRWSRFRPPLPDRPEQVRPVRLAYSASLVAWGLALVATFNAFIVAPIFATNALEGSWRFLPLVFAALYLIGVWALVRGHFTAGRLVLVSVASLQVISFARLIGLEPGTPFLTVLLLMAGPLFFARSERLWMLVSLGIAVAALAAIYLVAGSAPPVVQLDPSFMPIARGIVLGLTATLVVAALLWNNRLVAMAQEALSEEQERSEALLLNVLPAPVAERLKQGVNPLADGFDAVTVVFADIVGFTHFAAEHEPEDVVVFLNEIFSGFDRLADRHGVEKIKTIGDAYMVASGIPSPRADHADAAVGMALGMIDHIEEFEARRGAALEVRIGIHSGRVVAGVIGSKKFAYDLWGDTVNVASRLESSGAASRIHVSEDTYRLLGDRYRFESRGMTELRGRDAVPTYFLLGTSPEVATPSAG